jgi:hypothetical protein
MNPEDPTPKRPRRKPAEGGATPSRSARPRPAAGSAVSAPLTPTPAVPLGPTPAELYVERERRRLTNAIRGTQIVGLAFVIFVGVYIGGITDAFAKNLEPQTAATITTGMISQRVNDNIPELKRYVREQIPATVAKLPEYAKEQLPRFRQDLENQLEKNIDSYAKQTAPELATRVDAFLTQNKESVDQLLRNSQDPAALASLGQNMKQMFVDYLQQTQLNGETLKTKIDQSLEALSSVDSKLKHLEESKNLTENEKRARRAIAILLRQVDLNQGDLSTVGAAIPKIDPNPLPGTLQWKNQDEAIFTAPGKPPVVFTRKPQPSGKPGTTTPAPSKVPARA